MSKRSHKPWSRGGKSISGSSVCNVMPCELRWSWCGYNNSNELSLGVSSDELDEGIDEENGEPERVICSCENCWF